MMSKTKSIVYCGLFTTLIAIGAFIKIPIPVVPFTLQYLFTMMAGLLLGSKLGAISVTLYMLLGLVGLPIFAEGGGIWYIFKPSFGYIIGFIVGTFVTGYIAEKMKKKSFLNYLMANLAGLFFVYAIGMIYYYIISDCRQSGSGMQIPEPFFFYQMHCVQNRNFVRFSFLLKLPFFLDFC